MEGEQDKLTPEQRWQETRRREYAERCKVGRDADMTIGEYLEREEQRDGA